MATKINLEFPYSRDYISGYLNINKEPRRVISLVKKDGSRTSTSYARYIFSCNIGRYLDKKEHVDHIDNNKLNDTIDNLQILSARENNIKRNNHLGIHEKMITLNCPICFNSFVRRNNQILTKIKNGKTPTCSRTCGYKMMVISNSKGSISALAHNQLKP